MWINVSKYMFVPLSACVRETGFVMVDFQGMSVYQHLPVWVLIET